MADKQLYNCPACATRSLVDHCDSPTCTWHMCRNNACDLVVDLKRHLGHRRRADGKRVRWVEA